MKLFEVITEHCVGDDPEIMTTVQYVTASNNSLESVAKHFTEHCYQYEKELKGVKEVLVITQNILVPEETA